MSISHHRVGSNTTTIPPSLPKYSNIKSSLESRKNLYASLPLLQLEQNSISTYYQAFYVLGKKIAFYCYKVLLRQISLHYTLISPSLITTTLLSKVIRKSD